MNNEIKEILIQYIEDMTIENSRLLDKYGVWPVDHNKIKDMTMGDKMRYAADLADNMETIAYNMTTDMKKWKSDNYMILLEKVRPFKYNITAYDILQEFHDIAQVKVNNTENSMREFVVLSASETANDLVDDLDYPHQEVLSAIFKGMKKAAKDKENTISDINKQMRDN